MVERKPPFYAGLDWLNTRLRGMRSAFYPLLARGFFHIGLLLLIACAVMWPRLDLTRLLPPVDVAYPTGAPTQQATSTPSLDVHGLGRKVELRTQAERPLPAAPVRVTLVQRLFLAAVPQTIIPERARKGVITYTVAAGDNLLTIAGRFGLKPNTLLWANHELEEAPDLIYTGQELTILPVDGVYHTVADGETLADIASRYQVPASAIVDCEYNGLDSDAPLVEPGQKLIVPGGVKTFEPRLHHSFGGSAPADAQHGTGNWVWPTGGYISQGYWELHRAIDIAGAHGEGVVASDAGVVMYAAWDSNGYGNLVVIDHGNGFVTYYAHLYGFYVNAGESVERGQLIGARGSTGRSTGPHLHFEIRYKGVLRNPISFLPGQ